MRPAPQVRETSLPANLPQGSVQLMSGGYLRRHQLCLRTDGAATSTAVRNRPAGVQVRVYQDYVLRAQRAAYLSYGRCTLSQVSFPDVQGVHVRKADDVEPALLADRRSMRQTLWEQAEVRVSIQPYLGHPSVSCTGTCLSTAEY